MAPSFPDKDFIFGILAVQLGYASAMEVMRAEAAWLADEAVSIPERLLAEGAITRPQMEAIEATAAGLLADHGGDAEGALRALSADPTLAKVSEEAAPTIASAPTVAGAPGGVDTSCLEVEEVTAEHAGRYSYSGGSRDTAEIGRGGLGRVLIALDEHFGRKIAVKELLSDVCSQSGMVMRFLREARVTARLEHPNIVPVYELGKRTDGSIYYTMKLVRGKTLAAVLRGCKTLGERLKLLPHYVNLCHAIAYAHSCSVIHRDIKTDNVMVGEFGETVVLDWGLAKVKGKEDLVGHEIERISKIYKEGGGGVTVDGSTIGTPSYMSPEQAKGMIDEIDERSDVWSLGAVLYEILTGAPPFTGKTGIEIMTKVIMDPVIPPGRTDENIPPELSSICEKALARERSRRYGGAKEIAEEIEAFRSGARVRFHEYSSMELLKRFAAKNKAVLLSAAVILAVILAALITTMVYYQSEKTARLQEQQARQNEQEARKREKKQFLMASYHIAQAFNEKAGKLYEEKKYLDSRIYAAASLLHNPGSRGSPYYSGDFASALPESRNLSAWAFSRLYLSGLEIAASLKGIFRGDDNFKSVDFSPDGKLLASGCYDKTVKVWEVDSGKLLYTLEGHRGRVMDVAFSPDGSLLGSASLDTTVALWDVKTGRPARTLVGFPEGAIGVAFSPDGKLVAAGSIDKSIRLWQAGTGKPVGVLTGHKDCVRGMAFSPDGKMIASASYDETIKLWDAGSGKGVATLRGHTAKINDVAFSPDGTLLASASWDTTVRMWTMAGFGQLYAVKAHEQGVTDVAFTPDGRWLVSTGMDKAIKLWDPKTGRLLYAIDGHNDFIWGAAWSPDGKMLASAGYDRSVKLWEITPHDPILRMEGHKGRVMSVAWSPDGKLLASSGEDKSVRVWDARSGQPLFTLDGHEDVVSGVAFSPDGKLLASASWDATARLWDAGTGEAIRTIAGHLKSVRAVDFSPDGKLLATASADATVKLWTMPDGVLRSTFEGHGKSVRAVVFSPDGKLLASAGEDSTVRIWEAGSGKLLRSLKQEDWVTGLDFSGDGKMLAAACKDATVAVWDVASGGRLKTITGHTQWVNRVTFSPDGSLLATASDDRTIMVFSVETGEARLIIGVGGASEVTGVAFSPGGKTLALGEASSIVLYPLDWSALGADPKGILDEAQKSAGMKLEGFTLKLAD